MNIKETKKNIIPDGLNNWFVYRHIRSDKNMPFYIGIGKDSKRPSNKRCRSNFWKSIVSKTDYSVEVILDNLTKEQAIEKEIEFIELYGRVDLKKGTLCNMTNGGEGTGGLNPQLESERRDKIRKTLTGRKHSSITKAKCVVGQKGRIPLTIKGVEYPSLRQASLALGLHRDTIKSRYL